MTKKFLQIEMLCADHGDALWIEYGDKLGTRRILIDGGPIGSFTALDEKIGSLKAGASTFELIVVSHVDTDHIDGIVRLFAPKKATWKFTTKEVWFNGWKHLSTEILGPNQGEFLSALIAARIGVENWNTRFNRAAVVVPSKGALPRIPLADDFVITLLSPSQEKLTRMKRAWEKDVKAFKHGDLKAAWAALAAQKKYLPNEGLLGSTPAIEAEMAKQAKPDAAPANGSSIAFLAEFGGMSALFLADAHPGIVAESIKRLLVERGVKRLKVDAVKVAHHGSKGNTNDELLALIDSPNFLISTNGAVFRHPDEAAIQRIIAHSVHQPPTLHFNYKTSFNQMWDSEAKRQKLNYLTQYNSSETAPYLLRFER